MQRIAITFSETSQTPNKIYYLEYAKSYTKALYAIARKGLKALKGMRCVRYHIQGDVQKNQSPAQTSEVTE